MIYYTADHHFGHSNIIRFCDRPFKNVIEMDETLINNWNNAVSDDDIVYILGNLVFRSEKSASYYVERLKGTKHLVLGNHDHKWIRNCNLQKKTLEKKLYVKII